MIGNKLEQSIIKIFEENLSNTFSINSISKILKKAYPNINKKSNYLIREGVLGKIEVGNSYQCYLNLSNDKAKILLAMIEINKKDSLIRHNPDIELLISELSQLSKRFNVETVVLHKKNLLLVLRTSEKHISESERNKISEYTLLTEQYNILVLSRGEFQEYFLNNEDIRKYHYVLLYTENYVNIISEISALLIKNNLLSDNPSNFVKVSEKNAYYNDSNHNKITNRTIDKKITKKTKKVTRFR